MEKKERGKRNSAIYGSGSESSVPVSVPHLYAFVLDMLMMRICALSSNLKVQINSSQSGHNDSIARGSNSRSTALPSTGIPSTSLSLTPSFRCEAEGTNFRLAATSRTKGERGTQNRSKCFAGGENDEASLPLDRTSKRRGHRGGEWMGETNKIKQLQEIFKTT